MLSTVLNSHLLTRMNKVARVYGAGDYIIGYDYSQKMFIVPCNGVGTWVSYNVTTWDKISTLDISDDELTVNAASYEYFKNTLGAQILAHLFEQPRTHLAWYDYKQKRINTVEHNKYHYTMPDSRVYRKVDIHQFNPLFVHYSAISTGILATNKWGEFGYLPAQGYGYLPAQG